MFCEKCLMPAIWVDSFAGMGKLPVIQIMHKLPHQKVDQGFDEVACSFRCKVCFMHANQMLEKKYAVGSFSVWRNI